MATASDPTAKPDALAVLIRDHKDVDELFEQFDRSDDAFDGGLISRIVEALSVHTAVEEQIVYPAMRAALPDGEAKVRDAIADHQRVTKMLAELTELAPLDPAVPAKVQTLAKDVRAHVAEEESDLFPRLAEALDAATLQDMGRAIEKARTTAPETPPNDRVAGAVDRVRDLLGEAAEKGRELFESRAKKQP
jgi:hemerythrin superfamily protein